MNLKTDDKLMFPIEPKCSKCGHKGKMYIVGQDRIDFLKECRRLAFRGWVSGILAAFSLGLAVGRFMVAR